MLVLIACHLGFVRHNLQHLMSKSGNKVLTASTLNSAQEIIATNPGIDVIITDWKIRGGSAIDLQHFCRQIDRPAIEGSNSKEPEFIILITPNTTVDQESLRTEADVALEFGFQHILEKPFDRKKLLDTIRQIGRTKKSAVSASHA